VAPPPKKSSPTKDKKLLALGFLMLVVAAYLDNIRSPLMPIWSKDFSLAHSQLSFVILFGNICGLPMVFLLNPLLRKFGEKKVIKSYLVLALTLPFLAQTLSGYNSLLVFGLIIGVLIAVFGTLCNIVVIDGTDETNRARYLGGLHGMYGIGSLFVGASASVFPFASLHWSLLFWLPLPFLILKLVLAQTSNFPLQAISETPGDAKLGSFARFILIIFGFYVASEVGFSMWVVHYLTEVENLSVNNASRILTCFFVLLTLTRFALFTTIGHIAAKKLLTVSLCLAIISYTLGLLANPWFFMGVGFLGPFFPVMLSVVRQKSPDNWKAITIYIIVVTQLALALNHLGIGFLADALGMRTAFWIPISLLLVVITLVQLVDKSQPSTS
jgi:MFS transporter, FHS family, glucose/mannose:H+ symporter